MGTRELKISSNIKEILAFKGTIWDLEPLGPGIRKDHLGTSKRVLPGVDVWPMDIAVGGSSNGMSCGQAHASAS